MTATPSFQAIILAAGLGTRMHSATIKVLHEILGKPMIGHVVEAALQAGAGRIIPILGHQRDRVQSYLDRRPYSHQIEIALQQEQLGTAHAVFCALDSLQDRYPYTAILSGDVPNMDAPRLKAFFEATVASGKAVGLVTAILDDPLTYGRVLREDNQVQAIVEHKDASPEQRALREINAGIYIVQTSFLREALTTIMNRPTNNAQNEYYLTDLIALAADGPGVFAWIIDQEECIQGVNNRLHLARATDFARRRINHAWMLQGVTFLDPSSTLVETDVVLSPDVILHPGVHLAGQTSVGTGTRIEANVQIRDSTIGPHAHIKAHSYLAAATVGPETSIGPFAHLRPGAQIGACCKVGNFVEIKNTRLHDGAKASHLSYLGDAEVGKDANVGAGTITCNYDGSKKSKTSIGAGAFIGSNSALVAPVSVGAHAYVGAGSVITDDVPDRALGIARGRQRNIDDWADPE